MMRLHIPVGSLVVLSAFAPLAFAPPAVGQQLPPIRQLGAVVGRSSEPLTSVAGVRATAGGVLVNDLASRRVLLFDSSLTTVVVVADSTSATANAYSGRFGGLIPYRGDSTLFVDANSMSMLVIDPAGKVARVMSVPRSEDAAAFAGGPLGSAGYDPAGRLVYRSGGLRFTRSAAAHGGGTGALQLPQLPDSAAITRIHLETRTVDTVAFIKIPKVNMQMNRADDGTITMTSEVNPLPIVDDWAVLPDGSIAIVRGHDYHVDWIAPDGARRSTPKIPFEWQRLTDEDKAAFIDSVKAARERLQASGGDRAGSVPGMLGAGAPSGAQTMIVMRDGAGGGGGGAGSAPGNVSTRAPQVSFVSPDQLPDYKPPFFAGAVRADSEGHLWIRTIPTRAIAGGPVYDVVNRQGELVERVQLPQGRSVAGFGAGGVVYLVSRDGDKTVLERARAK
jgi:hypothetical protein